MDAQLRAYFFALFTCLYSYAFGALEYPSLEDLAMLLNDSTDPFRPKRRGEYDSHVTTFQCDDCGLRIHLPVVWDYYNKRALDPAPSCETCERVMRWDAELLQPTLSPEVEMQFEIEKARHLEALWEKRRQKTMAVKARRVAAQNERRRALGRPLFAVPEQVTEPLESPKVPFRARLRFLQRVERGWDERRQKRDLERPSNARQARRLPLFWMYRMDTRAEEIWTGSTAELYFAVHSGYVTPQLESYSNENGKFGTKLVLLDNTIYLDVAKATASGLHAEGWTLTPDGPERSRPSSDLAKAFHYWQRGPDYYGFGENWRQLEGVLSSEGLEAFFREGGKAQSAEDWRATWWRLIELPRVLKRQRRHDEVKKDRRRSRYVVTFGCELCARQIPESVFQYRAKRRSREPVVIKVDVLNPDRDMPPLICERHNYRLVRRKGESQQITMVPFEETLQIFLYTPEHMPDGSDPDSQRDYTEMVEAGWDERSRERRRGRRKNAVGLGRILRRNAISYTPDYRVKGYPRLEAVVPPNWQELRSMRPYQRASKQGGNDPEWSYVGLSKLFSNLKGE